MLGEAGIGKTRFVEEIGRHAASGGGQIMIGRCHETTQMLPFGPWVEALRAFGVVHDDDLRQALGPVWHTEVARLLPELGEPGLRLSTAPENASRLFEAAARLLIHCAARRPLMVLLEDLHWADEMSVLLLSVLVRRLDGQPIVLLGTAREEELPGAPALDTLLHELNLEERLLAVPLLPLSRVESRALVRALAGDHAEATALARLEDDVWTACKGNPFMVVETMRMLHEAPPRTSGPALPLPARVREVIAGRLQRLGERDRRLTAVAAAIGVEFDFRLLATAAGDDERETAAGVEELVRRRILHGVGDRFGFTHERIREVAYDAVLAARRRMLHAAVGAALEQLYADRLEAVYDRLACHYPQADDPGKAAEYLTRFARKATRAYAHADAVKAYDEALLHLERLPAPEADTRRLDIVPRLTRSLMFLGRFEVARDLLLAQRERVEQVDNPGLTGQYHLLLSHVYAFLGDRDGTIESARRAVAAAEGAADEVTVGKAFYLLAMEGWWSGEPEQGIEHGRRAIALLERTTERWWLGQAHFAVAANHVLVSDFESALDAAAHALAIGDALGDPRVQTPAAWITGIIHAFRGDWDEGIAAGRRALEYSPDPLNAADALGWLGYAYLEKGDAAEAIRLLEQSVENWSRFRVRSVQGGFRILLGRAYLMGGDVDRAARLAEEGLALTRATGYRAGIGCGERLLGLIAQRWGNRSEARALLEQALGTFTSVGCGYEAARTRLLLAEVCGALGDSAAATRAVDEAKHAFATLRVPKYTRWAEALAAKLGASRSELGVSRPDRPVAAAQDRVPRWA